VLLCWYSSLINKLVSANADADADANANANADANDWVTTSALLVFVRRAKEGNTSQNIDARHMYLVHDTSCLQDLTINV